MNKIVYKLPLPTPDEPFCYHLRVGAFFLHVAYQNGKPFLWFEVEPDRAETKELQFICVGTGWLIEPEYWYVGTLIEESFVWHYYAKFIDD